MYNGFIRVVCHKNAINISVATGDQSRKVHTANWKGMYKTFKLRNVIDALYTRKVFVSQRVSMEN
jgi:hypothetical protein